MSQNRFNQDSKLTPIHFKPGQLQCANVTSKMKTIVALALVLLFQALTLSALPFGTSSSWTSCNRWGFDCRSSQDEPPSIKSVQQSAAFKALLPSVCGKRPAMRSSERIVGGEEAQHGQFPWQAQILVRKPEKNNRLFFQCGGTIITDRVILSAAHCFKTDDPKLFNVVVGKHVSDTGEVCDEQRLEVERFLIHPRFDKRRVSDRLILSRVNMSWT